MRGVDLHAGKAGALGDGGGVGEAFDHFLYLAARQRARATVKSAGQSKRNGGRRHGRFRDQLRRLPPRMGKLHPDIRARLTRGCGPSFQAVKLLLGLAPVNRHIAGPFQIAPVDHDIAGDQEAGAAFGPAPVKRRMARSRTVPCIAKPFGHRRLGDPVFELGAARQDQRLCQNPVHSRLFPAGRIA